MGTVLHTQNMADIDIQATRQESTVRKMLVSWLTRNAYLKRQWKSYSELPESARVSYRAWSRHGAYIEMNRDMHN